MASNTETLHQENKSFSVQWRQQTALATGEENNARAGP
jgi:hypothetical protein